MRGLDRFGLVVAFAQSEHRPRDLVLAVWWEAPDRFERLVEQLCHHARMRARIEGSAILFFAFGILYINSIWTRDHPFPVPDFEGLRGCGFPRG